MHKQEAPHTDSKAASATEAERPPVFSSWRGWYLLVLATLFALIGFFYWLTIHFS